MKTSIRFLAVIFAVAMMVLAFTTVSANSFSDVTGATPHAKAIDSLTTLGIIHGYEDNTFRPDLPVRRDEMAKLVYTTFTTSTDAGEGVVTFPDVSANSWAKGYISWCAGMKIVGGYEDGTFNPEGNVTYDEALKMVCATLGYVDFQPGLWPVDVRLKALLDLNLGEGLDGVAGDAVLTRAQVAQLFHNALDEPMYIPPVKEEDKKPGMPTVIVGTSVKTLAKDIWGYTEVVAEVVATEKWGLEIPYAFDVAQLAQDETIPTMINASSEKLLSYKYTKTNTEDEIVIRFRDTDGELIIDESTGNPEFKTVNLVDLALEEYIGNSDDLLTRNLNIFIDKNGKYFSAQLKGSEIKDFTGSWGDTSNIPESEADYIKSSQKLGQRYHKFSLKIDGINHAYEDFHAIRKLVYKADGTVLAQPTVDTYERYYLDKDGNIINRVYYQDWKGNDNPTLSHNTLSFPRGVIYTTSNASVRKAIDSDGDGLYEYVVFHYYSTFVVDSVSKTQIVLKSAYDAKCVLNYEADKFHSDVKINKGDVIVGYFIGDEFFHVETTQMITAFSTKFTGSSTKLYGYGSFSVNTSLEPGDYSRAGAKNTLAKVADSLDPYVGINPKTNNYNYANYYMYNNTIVYAEVASAEDVKGVASSTNKAILLYVDAPTEPQINEKTKKYEVFYPAYLLINGKEELVNLKATKAINGSEAATVAQEGSPYRAYIKDGFVMYRNILVTFEVDLDGYYSLTIGDGEDGEKTDNNGNVIGKVLAENGYFLKVDPETKIMSIVDSGDNVILNKVVTSNSSVIYYPYTKTTTGCHEHIDFYYGSEVPADFEKKAITSDIYLTKNAEGLWEIETMMIGLEGFNAVETVTSGNYKKDARLHLLALGNKTAEYSEMKEDVFAVYSFKGIYEDTDVNFVNEEQTYTNAIETSVNNIYAWDDKEDNYVLVNDTFDSYKVENITEILTELDLVYTDVMTDGYKLLDTTKIIAIKDVPDNYEEEFLFEYITIEELNDIVEANAKYNEENSASEVVEARIGTYVDENKKTQIAYIIVGFVEYDEELEDYTFAGETK